MPELLVLKNGCKMKWDLAFILSLLPRRKCICLCCFPGFWSRFCKRAKRASIRFFMLFYFSAFLLIFKEAKKKKNKMSFSKAKLKVCLGFLWSLFTFRNRIQYKIKLGCRIGSFSSLHNSRLP